MNVETLDNLKLIQESARDFAENYIREHVLEWDEQQIFPVDLFHRMGEYGFMGILVPEAYGGAG
jgi:alkylation response protein AidB-like acyl-CoA dehydrogenase